MSMTEPERHELYELARRDVSERFAELMIKALPPEPERLATKDDVAILGGELRTEMADLRTEMADLRTELRVEMAELRTELRTDIADLRVEMQGLRTEFKVEIHDVTNAQTRTMMLGLVGSVTALAVTQMVVAAL